MGLKDFLFPVTAVAPKPSADVAASLAPIGALDSIGFVFGGDRISASRDEAMSIPAVSRARSIICSSIASVPMVVRDKTTGEVVAQPRVINQPDTRVNGAATWVYIAEDLLFNGYGYCQVTEQFADTFRVRAMQRVAPYRVTIETNSIGTEIDHYLVDGMRVSDTGLGSLVVFYGNDEGLLNRAGRTIRAGADLERAASMYAREPLPTMVLKSNGTALPADRIAKLLESWGASRRNRSTAFLNADVNIESLGFDAEKIQLAASRNFVATELARAVGIPAYFIDAETGSSMTYSNSQTTRQTLLDFSLRPLANSIEQRLSLSDFVPSSQKVEFDFDSYLRGSAKERADVYKVLNEIGALSIEEIRKAEDMIR
jgi:HK97 family phage portal protein